MISLQLRRRSLTVFGLALTLLASYSSSFAAPSDAPAFELPKWETGEKVKLADFAGEIVVLDFFAYWCVPCKRASQELESGIRVSSIYPGEIDTPILEARPTPVTKEQREKILKPEDVAAAILFVVTLPKHVSVPELIIKPTTHSYF